MLSFLRARQSLQAQPYAGYPGCHHPGNPALLLRRIHCPAVCSRSKISHPHPDRFEYLHADLHIYPNSLRYQDSFLDFHPDNHTFLFAHLDIYSQLHDYSKCNPHPNFHGYSPPHFHRHSHAHLHLHIHSDPHGYSHPHLPRLPPNLATLIPTGYSPHPND